MFICVKASDLASKHGVSERGTAAITVLSHANEATAGLRRRGLLCRESASTGVVHELSASTPSAAAGWHSVTPTAPLLRRCKRPASLDPSIQTAFG